MDLLVSPNRQLSGVTRKNVHKHLYCLDTVLLEGPLVQSGVLGTLDQVFIELHGSAHPGLALTALLVPAGEHASSGGRCPTVLSCGDGVEQFESCRCTFQLSVLLCLLTLELSHTGRSLVV